LAHLDLVAAKLAAILVRLVLCLCEPGF
jgi:hypothetical protein